MLNGWNDKLLILRKNYLGQYNENNSDCLRFLIITG